MGEDRSQDRRAVNADEIRAQYVEIIAEAFYKADAADAEATTGVKWPPWKSLDESGRWKVVHDARLAVDALAEVGRLPIAADYRWVYEPDGTSRGYRERMLFTPWREVAAPCSGCAVTERHCSQRRDGGKCCPVCRHPTRKIPEGRTKGR